MAIVIEPLLIRNIWVFKLEIFICFYVSMKIVDKHILKVLVRNHYPFSSGESPRTISVQWWPLSF